MKEITISELRDLFTYDPETGILRWAKRLSPRAGVGDIANSIQRSGRKQERIYFKVGIHGRCYLVHRICFAIHFGRWPDGEIDHVNGCGTDNRLLNIRDVSRTENQRNQKINSRNKHGKSGVMLDRGKYWRASIGVNGKQQWLGVFDSKEDAIRARNAAEIEHRYHENHGRK